MPSLRAIRTLSKLYETRLASKLKDTWYANREAQHEADIRKKDESHEQHLGQVIEQVKGFVADLGEAKLRVGQLEERLLQIAGPKDMDALRETEGESAEADQE